MGKTLDEKALKYHSDEPKGKLEVRSAKPLENQEELSLAYTPGVAAPCLKIRENPREIYTYTSKGNLVAVVSDGTAVLGLGDIGPYAGVPVMEGKCVLFKRFADVDAFPLCMDKVRTKEGRTDSAKLVEVAEMIAPCFGGINLEDIAAPECFEVEKCLKERLDIPVFHDDQHGTAIITLAGLLNSLELTGKKIEEVKVVFSGAGAAGIACANYYLACGVRKENLIMCDSRGAIYKGRKEGMNPYKEKLAADTDARMIKDALKGADVFVGVSKGNIVTEEMVRGMAEKPILFAMANPVPEISRDDALKGGAYVFGTGRSDYPNQANNVLGFPGIFRGALDVGASDVNEEMKLGASRALAELAKEGIPLDVKEYLEKAYPQDAKSRMFEGENPLKRDYVIPKPLDPRIVPRVARYVARAAMETGVARKEIDNLGEYEKSVRARIANSKRI